MKRTAWLLSLGLSAAGCETETLVGPDGGGPTETPVPQVWTQTHVAYAPIGARSFGDKVAVEGDDVYAAGREGATWRLWRLSRSNGAWSETGQLRAADIGATPERLIRALVVTEDAVWIGVLSTLENGAWTTADGEVWRLNRDLSGPMQISAPTPRSAFGASIAVSDDRVFIGAPGTDGREGAVHVYDLNGLQPTSEIRWQSSTRRPGFGATLAIDALRLYVAATGPCVAGSCGAGTVVVYDRAASGWRPSVEWPNPKGNGSFNFGYSLATDGAGGVVVGAPYDEDSRGPNGRQDFAGEAYLFSSGSTVAQALRPYGAYANSERFGFAVAAHGRHLVVGAPGDASSVAGEPGSGQENKGVAYLYTDGAFVERVEPEHVDRRDEVATGVAISSDVLVLGARLANEPDRTDEAGAISIFELEEIVETQ